MEFRKFGAVLAVVAATGQPMAVSAQEVCATQDEFRQVIGHLAPALIDNVVAACTSYLPAESALLTLGPGVASQYRSIATTNDAEFAQIFRKLDRLLNNEPDEDVPAEYLKAKLLTEIRREMQSDECALANKFAVDFAALPMNNVIGIIETVVYFREWDKRRNIAEWSESPMPTSKFCEQR